MIRKLLHNFRVAFLSSKSGTLSQRDDTLAPLVADSTRDNSIQDSTPISWWRTILVTSLGVTALVLGARQLGRLQQRELQAYDQMMVLRPPEPKDNRILIVTVTEKDLQKYGNELSDEIINKLLRKIQSYKPRVIGLHIKRPGQTNLAAGINKDNIVAVCAFEDKNRKEETEILPPVNFNPDNVGFRDFVSDSNNVVRRALLIQKPHKDGKCKTDFSFANLLAIKYLNKQNIDYDFPNDIFKLGDVYFPR